MKKRLVIIGLLIICIIIVIGVMIYFFNINEPLTKNGKNKQLNSDISDKKNFIDETVKWIGKYTSSDNNTIIIYKDGNDTIAIRIMESTDSDSSNYTEIKNIKCDSSNKVEYQETWFGKNSSIEIEMEDEKLIVKASSDNSDSIYNHIDGTYSKE